MFGKRGSILLSIGNLPPQISRKALKAHIQGVIDAAEGSGFRLTSAICSCNILRLTNPGTGDVKYQGLVSIRPAKLAFMVIRALERAPLCGLDLQVSRYRHGSFPVNASTPTVSMSELLGVDGAGGATPPKLDLVTDTGMARSANAGTENLPEATTDPAYAH
jgi:hypothetical protein